jgi:hypothetical protein
VTEKERQIVREILADTTAIVPLPPWLLVIPGARTLVGWLSALLVATIWTFASRIDLVGLLAAWWEYGKRHPPGPDPAAPGAAPALDQPPGGIPVPGDPHTGEQP